MWYFLIGTGVWLGLAASRKETFKDATWQSVVRGLVMGVLLWPLGAIMVFTEDKV